MNLKSTLFSRAARTLWVLFFSVSLLPAQVACELALQHKLIATEPGEAILRVNLSSDTVKNRRREPLNLALVLDRSSSMEGPKMAQAISAAQSLVDRLAPTDRLVVVSYANQARVDVAHGFVSDPFLIKKKIAGIRALGSTALHAGVSMGGNILDEHLEQLSINRVILLSDGQANIGPFRVSDLALLGQRLSSKGISVSTVGLGSGFNEDLMTALSRTGEGNAWFAESSSDLAGIFDQEFGDLSNIGARNLLVKLEFSEGFTPEAILTGQGDIQGRTATIPINFLVSDRDRYLLIKVRHDGGNHRDKVSVVTADVTFQAPNSSQRGRVAAYLTAQRDRGARARGASLNKPVLHDVAMNRYALAQAEATEMLDSGQTEKAMKRLEKENTYLAEAARLCDSPDLKTMHINMEDLTERLKREGMTSVNRKWMVNNVYQTLNQQSLQYDKGSN